MKIERFNTVVEIETSGNGLPPDKQDLGLFTTQAFTNWIRVNYGEWVQIPSNGDIETITEALIQNDEQAFRFVLLQYQQIRF